MPPVRTALVRAAQVLPPRAHDRLRSAAQAADAARARRAGARAAQGFPADAAARLRGIESSGRSLRLLLAELDAARATGQTMRTLRRHRWTDDRFGLAGLACSSALDLLVDGHLAQADWLAAQLVAADEGIRAAHEVRALVAIERHDTERARAHRARAVDRHADAPEVRDWVRRQQTRMAIRTVFMQLAGDKDPTVGGAVQLWHTALTGDPAQRDRLQALAVAQACRPGSAHDPALWCTRYLFERRSDLGRIAELRGRLDAEESLERTARAGDARDGVGTVGPEAAQPEAVRPEATWPHATDVDIAVVLYCVGPQVERDLRVAVREVADVTDADVVIVHGGLDPVTITACVEALPRVRFVAGDVRRWAALRVSDRAARRMMALDGLRSSGYRRVVLAPVTSGLGEHVRAALRADDDAVLPAVALRDDVVAESNFAVVDAGLTGVGMTTAIDAAVAGEFGVGGRPDDDVPWRVLRALRDRSVVDGQLHEGTGFTASHVPVVRLAEVGDDESLVERADALAARVDNAGACELFEHETQLPYRLTDRVLLRWATALHRCSCYVDSLDLLELCTDRDAADTAGAGTAWVLHDHERLAACAHSLTQRSPDHPRAAELRARAQAPEPTLPDSGSALVHVASYVGRGGNYGDRVLPLAVRAAISSVSTETLTFVQLQAHQVFDDVRRELADRSSGVIVGGGGLFLPDTAPNGNSGWQWNVPADQLRRLDVPLAVVAVGFNLFRGQSFSGSLFAENLARLVDRADVVGLRNHGSIRQVRALLPDHLAAKIEYLPCPTTVLAHLDPTTAGPVERERSVLINAAYDRSSLRFGDDYSGFLTQLASYVTQLHRDGVDVRIVSHMAPDERLAADLRSQYELDLPLLRLDNVPLAEAYDSYRRAGVVVGMRGHATMIPFGLRTPVLSLVSHPKMRYFLDDIGHDEWGFEIGEPFGAALLERTRHVLASPGTYIAQIDAAQQILRAAVQEPLRRFVQGQA